MFAVLLILVRCYPALKYRLRSIVGRCNPGVLTLCGLLSLLSACQWGPDYQRPETLAQTPGWHHAARAGGATARRADLPDWWRHYQDPLLNRWVERLNTENLGLKAALERIIQAREQVGIEGGARLPGLGLSGDGVRGFAPDLVNNRERAWRSDISVGANISWQVDLFGRVRRAVEAAEFQALAREQDYLALRHVLIAELVSLRARLALLEKEIEIQTRIVASREQTLNSVNRRYQLGVRNASAVDVHSARENLSTARATLAGLGLARDETYLGIDRLLNQAPGESRPAGAGFPLLPPMPLPALVSPAHLLDQRPDIRGNEFRLMAANAGIGVAVADLFPDLTLSANRGFTGTQAGGLLGNDRALGSIAARINTRLFEGGRLRANIRLREAQARELSRQYADTVLSAMMEVETALVQEQSLHTQVDSLRASVISARRAEVLSRERYQRGITSLLELLDTQRRWQNAERNLLAAQQASWNARINLHLALGGDWRLGQVSAPGLKSPETGK